MRETNTRMQKALRFAAAGGALAGLLIVGNGVLADQGGGAAGQNLVYRLSAAEIRARALQSQVRADQRRLGIQVAGLFGPDEEEQQREQAQDASITQLNQRVGELEQSLQQLTGQIEQLQHRIDQLNTRMDRMQKDFDYKLCSMAGQQLSAGAGDQPALPCNPGGNQQSAPDQGAAAMPSGEPAGGAEGPAHLAPPPGVLGSLTPAEANAAGRQQASLPPSSGSGGDANGSFNAAMDLLAKAQYDQARSAFRAFADANPKDPLTPQAIYWVGDIAFVQKDYPTAARTFAEEIKRFPASARAPESMLRLGQSLIAMNQKQEGCTALAALASKYPNASKNISGQAAAARKDAGCR